MSEGTGPTEFQPSSPEFRTLLGSVSMFASMGEPLKNGDSILLDGLYDQDPELIVGNTNVHTFEKTGHRFEVRVESHDEIAGMVDELVRHEDTGATRMGYIRFEINESSDTASETKGRETGNGWISIWSNGLVEGNAEVEVVHDEPEIQETYDDFLRSLGFNPDLTAAHPTANQPEEWKWFAQKFSIHDVGELAHTVTSYIQIQRTNQ